MLQMLSQRWNEVTSCFHEHTFLCCSRVASMLSTLRNVRKKQWLKIWAIWVLLVILFLCGLMSFLKIFLNIPYPTDPAVEKHMGGEEYVDQGVFPKILHHSWKTESIPTMWQGSYNACVSLNKGYTYMLWTDEKIDAFMETYYPWFKAQFDSYKYKIQKIDVFRYFILYHYGGVYIDLDIKCKFPFSTILNNISKDHGMLLPGTWPVGVSNEFIVAKQHHPFLRYIISKLRYAHHEYGLHYFTILASTGPMFVSRCLETYGPAAADVYLFPLKQHKWEFFEHIEGDTWQWWDMWLVNWWVSWVIAGALLFCATTFCVLRCCGYGNGNGNGKGTSPKYEKLSNGSTRTHRKLLSV
jgi:hypothetical protein